MTNRPWLGVAWDKYYPSTGLGNIRGAFETAEEAERAAKQLRKDEGWENDAEDFADKMFHSCAINIVDFMNKVPEGRCINWDEIE